MPTPRQRRAQPQRRADALVAEASAAAGRRGSRHPPRLPHARDDVVGIAPRPRGRCSRPRRTAARVPRAAARSPRRARRAAARCRRRCRLMCLRIGVGHDATGPAGCGRRRSSGRRRARRRRAVRAGPRRDRAALRDRDPARKTAPPRPLSTTHTSSIGGRLAEAPAGPTPCSVAADAPECFTTFVEQLGDDEVDRARDLRADGACRPPDRSRPAPTGRALPAATRVERSGEAAVLQQRRRDAADRARSSSSADLACTWASRASWAAASESPDSARRSSAARSSCRRTRRCCGPSWMSRSRRRSAASSACTAAPRAAASARTSAARSSDGQRPSMPRAIAWWSRANPPSAHGRVIVKTMPAMR